MSVAPNGAGFMIMPNHICTHFILVHMHRMAQGVAARVSKKHVHTHVIMCLIVRCLSVL